MFKFFVLGESRYNLADLLSAPPPLESEEEPPVYKESEEVFTGFMMNFACSHFVNLPDEKIAAEVVKSLPASASERWNHRFGGGGAEDVGGDRGRGGELIWNRVHRAEPHRLPAWYFPKS